MSDNPNYSFLGDEDDEVARERAIDRQQAEYFGDCISLERTDDDFAEEIEEGYDREEVEAEREE